MSRPKAFRADVSAAIAVILAFVILIGSVVAAWITHVVVCIKTAQFLFLVIGALFFPIAIIRGVGHWFGAF